MGEQNVCDKAKKLGEEERIESEPFNEQIDYFERRICPKCASRNTNYNTWTYNYKCHDCGYKIKRFWDDYKHQKRKENEKK